MTTEQTAPASLENPQDAGEGSSGVVKRWLLEWDLADKEEKGWRKDASEAIDIYVNGQSSKTRFNILYSNTQTLSPALYSKTPRPDVRRRFRDPDPEGKKASEILERGLAASIDMYDFDNEIKSCVEDHLLTGRGVVWVSYKPMYGDQLTAADGAPLLDDDGQPLRSLVYEETTCECVGWDRFRMGRAKKWADVPWVGRIHYYTRKELVEEFGEKGKKVKLDWCPSGMDGDDGDDASGHKDAMKRGVVYEIWDKAERRVVYISPSYKDEPLLEKDDPYDLEGFFPVPRPLYSIRNPDSLVPVPEFKIYEDQAKELDDLTKRIKRLVSALRARGIYDSTLKQLENLMQTDEAGLVPSEGITAIMQMGGLEKAIWMFPIETIAKVLLELYRARDQIKQTIFEITGLSDIVRGSTKAVETATAQSIKAQFGSMRLQDRQNEVQRLVRDVFRIKAEIIAEKFTATTLGLIAGSTADEIAAALELLKSDLNRKIRVDVETDSTIASDEESDKRNITELLTAIGSFLQQWIPLVQQGLPVEVPKALLLTAVRRFKMGREVEDALNLLDQAAMPAPVPPAPVPGDAAAAGAPAGQVLPPPAMPAQPVMNAGTQNV
ncbi:MAG: hypothetical protein GC149_20380 [Gammaproteobacteria bacterium]|nr:hypothetical protein [Gammaproteobacteria bacterium]